MTENFKTSEASAVFGYNFIKVPYSGGYYKDAPYTPHSPEQRLIITYSPKYARYQKTIRNAQVERAEKNDPFW